MTTATVTSKGQVTIPAKIRADLKVGAGDRIEFVRINEGHYEVIAATRDITQLRGRVKTQQTISVEEMNTAIGAQKGR